MFNATRLERLIFGIGAFYVLNVRFLLVIPYGLFCPASDVALEHFKVLKTGTHCVLGLMEALPSGLRLLHLPLGVVVMV